jgi:hypothetical protein
MRLAILSPFLLGQGLDISYYFSTVILRQKLRRIPIDRVKAFPGRIITAMSTSASQIFRFIIQKTLPEGRASTLDLSNLRSPQAWQYVASSSNERHDDWTAQGG